jgi:uncharacterized membrane protein
MEPLIVLVTVTALLLVAGVAGVRRLRSWHGAMVPPALPAPELMVTLTGILELRASQELGPRIALQVVFLAATLAILGRYLTERRRRAAPGPVDRSVALV